MKKADQMTIVIIIFLSVGLINLLVFEFNRSAFVEICHETYFSIIDNS